MSCTHEQPSCSKARVPRPHNLTQSLRCLTLASEASAVAFERCKRDTYTYNCKRRGQGESSHLLGMGAPRRDMSPRLRHPCLGRAQTHTVHPTAASRTGMLHAIAAVGIHSMRIKASPQAWSESFHSAPAAVTRSPSRAHCVAAVGRSETDAGATNATWQRYKNHPCVSTWPGRNVSTQWTEGAPLPMQHAASRNKLIGALRTRSLRRNELQTLSMATTSTRDAARI